MNFSQININQNFVDTFDTEWQKISTKQAKCLKSDLFYDTGAVEYFEETEEVSEGQT